MREGRSLCFCAAKCLCGEYPLNHFSVGFSCGFQCIKSILDSVTPHMSTQMVVPQSECESFTLYSRVPGISCLSDFLGGLTFKEQSFLFTYVWFTVAFKFKFLFQTGYEGGNGTELKFNTCAASCLLLRGKARAGAWERHQPGLLSLAFVLTARKGFTEASSTPGYSFFLLFLQKVVMCEDLVLEERTFALVGEK